MFQILSPATIARNDYYISNMIFRFFELTNKRVFKFYYGGGEIKIKKSSFADDCFFNFYPETLLKSMEHGDWSRAARFQIEIVRVLKYQCYINKINFFKDISLYVNNSEKNKKR